MRLDMRRPAGARRVIRGNGYSVDAAKIYCLLVVFKRDRGPQFAGGRCYAESFQRSCVGAVRVGTRR